LAILPTFSSNNQIPTIVSGFTLAKLFPTNNKQKVKNIITKFLRNILFYPSTNTLNLEITAVDFNLK